jgi:DNA polymerase III subunit epsilon
MSDIYSRYIAVDVETSGLNPLQGGRVIEVAAVALRDGRIVAEYATLIDVTCEIHPGAARVHGITRRMLQGEPGPEEAWRGFLEFVENSPLIAHNAGFDIRYIRHELARLGLSLMNRSICTLSLARRRYPQLQNHRLESVARHVLGGIPSELRLHRALDDARLAARVWVEMEKTAGAH